jgi:hypothetical protein
LAEDEIDNGVVVVGMTVSVVDVLGAVVGSWGKLTAAPPAGHSVDSRRN